MRDLASFTSAQPQLWCSVFSALILEAERCFVYSWYAFCYRTQRLPWDRVSSLTVLPKGNFCPLLPSHQNHFVATYDPRHVSHVHHGLIHGHPPEHLAKA